MSKLDEPDITGKLICHNIPEETGVYLVTDSYDNVLYVGQSNSLRRRIAYLHGHVRDKTRNGFTHDASDPLLRLQETGEIVSVNYIVCEDYKERERKLKREWSV